MPPLSNVLAFAATVVVIVAIPGPSVLFTVSRALTAGRQATLTTVAGNAAGVLLQVVAVAFGMGALVESSAVAYTVVKFVGAAYIGYLGVQAIRHRHSMAEALAQRVAAVTRLHLAQDPRLSRPRERRGCHAERSLTDARQRCPFRIVMENQLRTASLIFS